MQETTRTKILCGAFFTLGVSLAFIILYLHEALSKQAICTIAGQSLSSNLAAAPPDSGAEMPWGTLKATEIPLACPEGELPDGERRLTEPKWVFEDTSEGRLTRFFNGLNLRPAEKATLLDKRTWEIGPKRCVVSPPEQLIWSLNPDARQRIYSVLSRTPSNFPQRYPFHFALDGLEEKFKNCGLTAENVEQLRWLSYTNGGYLCFTDLQAMKHALNPEQFQELVESLYEVPTYVLGLRLNPHSNVEGLVKYWGKGGREHLIAPLLTALAKVPGGAGINVSYLLPPFARLRLYTYPFTLNDPTAQRSDCFFTSMNFFNEKPDTNFFNASYTAQMIHTQYSTVVDQPVFGDLITLVNGKGESIHACVFIAADYVFTKNGVNSHQPWVLMKLSDMVMMYSWVDSPVQIRFLRRKPGREGPADEGKASSLAYSFRQSNL
ncbi:MAG: hypothetical protein C5B50_12975 [Verrucomicrobia bacterium]|nr:MAG: hypothetical protein C5B50_12975 [Verrucomicrobiota bacterium]